MKLKRFLLRYYPSGIVLEFARKSGEVETRSIDLLNLTPETDIDMLLQWRLLHFRPCLHRTLCKSVSWIYCSGGGVTMSSGEELWEGGGEISSPQTNDESFCRLTAETVTRRLFGGPWGHTIREFDLNLAIF